jgi:hypothetical protein
VPDGSLANLLAKGVEAKLTFQLKSGSYVMREVVTDSEDQLLTAESRNIQIP